MSTIWVLGNGQLGAMLQQSAIPLGISVKPVDIHSDTLPLLAPNDLVTAEREQWPETPITATLSQHPNFINGSVFGRLADRLSQKQLLDQLHLSTAPWQPVTDEASAEQLLNTLGEKVLLKRRTGGYDGRGQHWLKLGDNPHIPNGWENEAIAEQAINFDDEVSLVGVRTREGELFFYPITWNLHVDGILMASVAQPKFLSQDTIKALQTQAESMLTQILVALDYVGVMAMETFRLGDQLMINELAPRVHNSGHWTQAGASYSQFEAHIRATAGLPLAPITLKGDAVMINLIGTEFTPGWLSVPGAEVYWYQKGVRAGRKVGHINFCSFNQDALVEQLKGLKPTLPEAYRRVIDWTCQQLQVR
ncbi:5-(carboxyamino)imidazole ribonucleotide synthase [Marinibactrum halimedae]|uniref:N5-carboxyaminoimidazole ribonucleotide synthase n=1 Tax=Marinibactrum halimedae TaxID=1444977 RepID=A0AA37TAE9_9GAMM|nr:5-(carboxyamino)imidazole ribonucleotide synthase [Marinibactrum halimedae]MCD9460379.1 5-(carboxyamino)imidazole ribonucleotide synthase [Marinibactrum halimedae]GLS26816.1 N5-carboxyaminoimidazole ribonucleotide synthase [Marinibactrum halimedae]